MSKFKLSEIKGVIPAMMTFFDENENIDYEATKKMLDFMMAKEVDGLYLTGSTGLTFTMTSEERQAYVQFVCDYVDGRLPIIVHVGAIGTKKSIALAKQAEKAGADAISSVPPFYWHFSAEDIYNYYRDVSESVEIPMVVYNIVLAGTMDTDLLLKIASLPNVGGLKYTARSHDEMGFLKTKLGKDFMIYSGCDEMAFSGLCFGADGIIGSFYNLIPDFYKALYRAVEESDIPKAMRLQKIADEFIFACLKYDFPSVGHNVLTWRGLPETFPRRPFTAYKDADLGELKKAVKEIIEKYDARELDVFDF